MEVVPIASPNLPTPEEIRTRLAPLLTDPGLRLVLLFGSLPSGTVHPGSDIDLGLLYDAPVDTIDLTNRITGLLKTDRIDAVDLRRASPLLCFTAVQNGRVLFERSAGEFIAFYSLSFRRYVDTRKLREFRDAGIRNFLKERGLC